MSTMELFLTGKKVKLSKNTNLDEVIKILKLNNIHTKYIENKEKLHSLFFLDSETMFLIETDKADKEFEYNHLKEILEKDFLHLLDYNVENKEGQETIKKTLKSKFLKIQKDNNIILYRKKNIKSVRFVKDESAIIILFKSAKVKLENVIEEDYFSIENQLLN